MNKRKEWLSAIGWLLAASVLALSCLNLLATSFIYNWQHPELSQMQVIKAIPHTFFWDFDKIQK